MIFKNVFKILPIFIVTLLIFLPPYIGQTKQLKSPADKISKMIFTTLERLKSEGTTAENAASRDLQRRFNTPITYFDKEGRYGLLVHVTDVSYNILMQLRNLGGDVVMAIPEAKIIAVYLPINRIEDAAKINEVQYIWPNIGGGIYSGSKTSEGDSIHHAITVRSELNVKGDSIKVGVISDGCSDWKASRDSGDLPLNFDSTHYTFKNNLGVDVSKIGLGDEGTAMLEIVHDIAPNADLYFYGALHDAALSAAHIDAIQRLVREKGCKIIVDDLYWYNQPFFEDSTAATNWTIAAAARWAIDTGVVYISAAGNFAAQPPNYMTRSHHQQTYSDFNPNQFAPVRPLPQNPLLRPGIVDLHDFAIGGVIDPALQIIVNPGPGEPKVTVVLEWNEPWGVPPDDFDLYLYDSKLQWQKNDGGPGINPQPGNPPYEIVTHTNHYTWPETLNIVINRFSPPGPTTPLLGIFIDGDNWAEYCEPNNSIWGHPGVSGVIAVGAVPYSDTTTIEPYSSRGNYDVYIPFPESRPKPDVVAVDNVIVRVHFEYQDGQGNWRFPGTSAAAPHVAGMAALLLSKCPTMTPAQVHSKFERTATDLGAAGFDQIFGNGFLDIERAMLEVNTASGLSGPYSMTNTTNVPMFFATDDGYAVSNIKITGGVNQPTNVQSTVKVTNGNPYEEAGIVNLGCPTIKRWYQLTQSGGTNGQFDAQVGTYIAESERNAAGISAGNMRIVHWNGSYYEILPIIGASSRIGNTWKVKGTFNNASFSPFFVAYLTRGIDVTTVSNNEGNLDSTVAVEFSVKNTGNGWDTLTFSVRDTRDWVISPNDSGFALSANEKATVNIQVTIPLIPPFNGRNRCSWDDDGDGFIDEDPKDGIDNDSDGKIDEDYCAMQDTMGTVDTIWLVAKSVSDPTYNDSSFATVTLVPVTAVIPLCIANGWNMVSVPLILNDMHKDSVFTTSRSDAFTYHNRYVVKDSLELGAGYWLKFQGAQIVNLTGGLIERDTIELTKRWNMIGSISYPVAVSSITQIPDSFIVSPYWGYSSGYHSADTLFPGKAYWVKADTAGEIVLKKSGVLRQCGCHGEIKKYFQPVNTLKISDAEENSNTLFLETSAQPGLKIENSEMPPVPPAGAFDARFGTGRYIEFFENNVPQEIPILVSTKSYPVKIEWNFINGKEVNFSLVVGGKPIKMSGTSKCEISNPKSIINLRYTPFGKVELPAEFALEQNYPNPFNPATIIRYHLPVSCRVNLKVYNMLGQEVITLADGVQEAGYKSVEFNANLLSSGIYTYKLTAGSFSDVKKMLLIK